MNTVPLRLRYTDAALRDPVAWLISDPRPAVWIRALLDAGLPASRCTLYVLPTSRCDRTASAALLLPPAGAALSMSVLCRPYGCIAGKLYLPVEARVEPDVASDEWPVLLPQEGCLVWHPSVGLIGCDPQNALRISDLLQAPAESIQSWSGAVPGIAFNARLRGVIPTWSTTADEVLNTGGGEIGTKPIVEPLDSPGGRPGSISIPSWLSAPLELAARPFEWLGRNIPGLGQFAEGLARFLPPLPALEDKRRRELERLVEMLNSNPDEGLRFAIPFGGDAHRGLARPGADLQRNSTEFDLNSLHGSGAADFWNIPPDLQQQLVAHYRRLALRELQLGRHRRAAYVYAKLLGDLQSAIGALKQGRFFREAAVIYRDKLNQPLEAARCLADGGLWREAAEEFEKQGVHETAGDLWQKLDEPDLARGAFRRAVDIHWQHDDILSAARLLHQKLGERDEALSLLDAAWPHSKQSILCLREGILLRSEWGRHDEVEERLGRISEQPLSADSAVGVTEVLAETALTYPVATIRANAEDFTRVVAARSLEDMATPNQVRIMTALKSLARQDRLLARDCQRYMELSTARKPQSTSATRPSRGISLRERIAFDAQWVGAVTVEDAWYAVGVRDDVCLVARQCWRAAPDTAQMSFFQAVHSELIQFVGPHSRNPRIDICAWGHSSRPPRDLPASADLPVSVAVRLRDIGGERIRGIARSLSNGATWTLVQGDDGMLLNGTNRDDILMTQSPLPAADWSLANPMHARDDGVFIVAGRQLLTKPGWDRTDQFQGVELPGNGTSIAGSGPFTRLRVAVGLEHGAVVIWWEGGKPRLVPCAEDLAHTIVGFTRSGRLVVAAENDCEVYSTSDGKLNFLGAAENFKGTPVAVTSTCDADGFALFLHDGRILQG